VLEDEAEGSLASVEVEDGDRFREDMETFRKIVGFSTPNHPFYTPEN